MKVNPKYADKAKDLIHKGINILKKEKNISRCAIGNYNLGELNIDAGNNEKGLKYLKAAEAMFIEMDMSF